MTFRICVLNISYGIIRNVELELTEEKLLECLRNCNKKTEIISVKRLRRRMSDGWTPSESVRIGFKGDTVPEYIYLYNLKIKINQFVFPVTQGGSLLYEEKKNFFLTFASDKNVSYGYKNLLRKFRYNRAISSASGLTLKFGKKWYNLGFFCYCFNYLFFYVG